MKVLVLVCLLVCTFAESETHSSFQRALQKNREAHRSFYQGQLVEAYQLARESLESYSRDSLLNQSVVKLGTQIYAKEPNNVFKVPEKLFSIGFAHRTYDEGSMSLSFEFNAKMPKKDEIRKVEIKPPFGPSIDVYPNGDPKTLSTYPADDPEFTIYSANSKAIASHFLKSGLFHLKISTQSGQSWNLPLFFFVDPDANKKLSLRCDFDSPSVEWSYRKWILNSQKARNPGRLYQYDGKAIVPVQQDTLDLQSPDGKGRVTKSLKNPPRRVLFRRADSALRTPLSVYYVLSRETRCY